MKKTTYMPSLLFQFSAVSKGVEKKKLKAPRSFPA